jgi:hypothetical protein
MRSRRRRDPTRIQMAVTELIVEAAWIGGCIGYWLLSG